MKIIILAGGGGVRLWPLSRQSCPKQFLKLTGERENSLLIETILRCLNDNQKRENGPPDDIYVVTSQSLEPLVQAELRQAGFERLITNIISEPVRRNTAPAIALAAQTIYESCRDENEILAILPADHVISDIPVFQARLREGAVLASQGALVTLGVVPTHPATGYGYIEVAEHKENRKGHADSGHPSIGRPVHSFREKPDADTARRYLATGRHYWNAGIFMMSIATLREALQTHMPQIDALIRQGARYGHRHFDQMPDISIDYAILEKASNIRMLPLEASWSDVGCWDSIYEILAKDENENALQCRDFQHAGTRRSLVWSETGRHIATVGVEDLIVIDTPDILAIIRRGDAQSVKNLALDRVTALPGSVVSKIREQAAKTTEAPTQETADASP